MVPFRVVRVVRGPERNSGWMRWVRGTTTWIRAAEHRCPTWVGGAARSPLLPSQRDLHHHSVVAERPRPPRVVEILALRGWAPRSAAQRTGETGPLIHRARRSRPLNAGGLVAARRRIRAAEHRRPTLVGLCCAQPTSPVAARPAPPTEVGIEASKVHPTPGRGRAGCCR